MKREPFTVQPGDKVAYAVQFLQSIGAHTGELPAARGTVVAVQQLGDRQLAAINWGAGTDLPPRVMTCNLARVGPNSRFCAC